MVAPPIFEVPVRKSCISNRLLYSPPLFESLLLDTRRSKALPAKTRVFETDKVPRPANHAVGGKFGENFQPEIPHKNPADRQQCTVVFRRMCFLEEREQSPTQHARRRASDLKATAAAAAGGGRGSGGAAAAAAAAAAATRVQCDEGVGVWAHRILPSPTPKQRHTLEVVILPVKTCANERTTPISRVW